jgi:hypothetical protein
MKASTIPSPVNSEREGTVFSRSMSGRTLPTTPAMVSVRSSLDGTMSAA